MAEWVEVNGGLDEKLASKRRSADGFVAVAIHGRGALRR
jgi:hypothetical protein